MTFVIVQSVLMLQLSTLNLSGVLVCENNMSWLRNINLTFGALCIGLLSVLLNSMLRKLILFLFYHPGNFSATKCKIRWV